MSKPNESLPTVHADDWKRFIRKTSFEDVETTLLALTEVDPEELAPELRAEYERDLQEAIRSSAEKRERVAIKLFDLGQRAAVKRAAADAHGDKADELERAAQSLERNANRLKEYVLTVMRELPKPARGVRTLEGTSATFKAKDVADSIEIYDEALLPDEFKTATVTMPLALWRQVCLYAPLTPQWGRVASSEIKAALQARETCSECKGAGNKEHTDMDEGGHITQEYFTCEACSGSGEVTATIPGARLVANKLRLEVS